MAAWLSGIKRWMASKRPSSDNPSKSSDEFIPENSSDLKLFFSYSRKNLELGRRCRDSLKATGAEVFFDEESIQWGEHWRQRIAEAVKNCDALVVLGCPESVKAEWVEKEIYYALDHQKPVMPWVTQLNLDWPAGLGIELNRIQYVLLDEKRLQAQAFELVTRLSNPAVKEEKPLLRHAKSSWFERYKTEQCHHILPDLIHFTPLSVELPQLGQQPKIYSNLKTLVEDEKRHVLLIGEPGAGKTTLLKNLQVDMLKNQEDVLPVLISLNTYEAQSKENPNTFGDWIHETWHEQVSVQAPNLGMLLEQKTIWLLLDALNEMPYRIDEREARFDDLAKFVKALPSTTKVVVSCRIEDIEGEWQGARAVVKPMDADDMRAYLQKACEEKFLTQVAIGKVLGVLEEQNAQELYQNPYRLSLLASFISEDGEVPRNRAELFSQSLRETLRREKLKKSPSWPLINRLLSEDDRTYLYVDNVLPPPKSESLGLLFSCLGQMALAMQSKGPGTLYSLSEVKELWGDDVWEDILKAGLALNVLSLKRGSSGRRLGFIHQQYLEYFAARAWLIEKDSQKFDRAHRPYLANDPAHVPALEELIQRLNPGDKVAERKRSGWEETAAMAMQLAEDDDDFILNLGKVDPVEVGRWVLSKDSQASNKVKDVIRTTLLSWLQNPKVELRARVDAGLVLDEEALLGLGFICGKSPEGDKYWLPPVVRVQAGRYRLGVEYGQRMSESDQDVYDFELKEPFDMAKYPVTRAEYECFVEAGGYDDTRWWPEDSDRYKWRQGLMQDVGAYRSAENIRNWHKGTLEERSKFVSKNVVNNWRRLRSYTSLDEAARYLEVVSRVEELRRWPDSFVRKQIKKQDWGVEQHSLLEELRRLNYFDAIEVLTKRSSFMALLHPGRMGRPAFWYSPEYSKPLQPVIGICYFEAQAYLAWLSWASGKQAQMPTEQQWEAAARGFERRLMAYGAEFSALHCNTQEGGQRNTTPIAAYPTGQTAEGIHDLYGNIWEWTNSPFSPDSKPTIRSLCVGLGGSWYYPWNYARGAYRYGFTRDGQGYYLGMRLVFPPADF